MTSSSATIGAADNSQGKGGSLGIGLLALTVVTIWGLTFVSFTVTAKYFTPGQILLLRTIIAYAALWILYPHFHKPESAKIEAQLFFAGLCGVTLYVCLTNYALTMTATSNVSVLSSISPIFAALLMPLFFRGSKIGGRVILGFIVAGAGAAIVSTGGNFAFTEGILGSLLALGSAVAWGCYTNLLRHLKKSQYSQNYVTRRILLYAIVTVIPVLAVANDPFHLEYLLIPECLLNMLFLGLVAVTFCHVGWGLVTRKKGVVWASQFQYLTPIATMIGSWLILGDAITPVMIGGTALVLGGVMVADKNMSAKVVGLFTGKRREDANAEGAVQATADATQAATEG